MRVLEKGRVPILESAFFKAGLYAAAALIGYQQGQDVPGLSPAIDAFCEALDAFLNRRLRGQAARIGEALRDLGRAERIDIAPVEATLEDLFARYGLQAPELIDLDLDPERAAEYVRGRGEAVFIGLSDHERGLVYNALKRTYATLIEDTDFLQTAQANVLRALLAQRDAINALPLNTAQAVRSIFGANLLDARFRILPTEPREAELLWAEYAAVPFDPGRESDLERLIAWCCNEAAKRVRLIVGAGGMGKTRLAMELGKRLRRQGWCAGFLQRDADHAPTWALQELLADSRDICIIVDYADTRRPVLEDLLRRFSVDSGGRRLRMLLLARAAGQWWDDLRSRDGDVRALFERLGGMDLEERISALALTTEERHRVFDTAAQAFAEKLGLLRQAPLSASTDLGRPQFAQVLFLHMKALAALRGDRLETEDELLEWVLRREEGSWRQALDAAHLPPDHFFVPFAQACALLTLAGGAAASEAPSLLRRLPLLADQPRTTLESIIGVLARLYPAEDTSTIGGVRPDVLGEQLVDRQLRRDERLLDAVFVPSSG